MKRGKGGYIRERNNKINVKFKIRDLTHTSMHAPAYRHTGNCSPFLCVRRFSRYTGEFFKTAW